VQPLAGRLRLAIAVEQGRPAPGEDRLAGGQAPVGPEALQAAQEEPVGVEQELQTRHVLDDHHVEQAVVQPSPGA